MAAQYQQGIPGFGKFLRQHRTQAGFSQEALAERAGLSARAISDLERGVKVRPHPATMRALADALELEPADRAALAAASRPGAGIAAAAPVPHGLPMPTSPIIGRNNELKTATTMLRSGLSRLLTLTGPGGVGKTRLSLEIARTLASDYPDGVIFVELAMNADPALVTSTVAVALQIRTTGDQSLAEAIREYVGPKRLLIVLDNCEHVLDSVRSLVTSLILEAAELNILATSRSPLHLRSEQLMPITPLEVPDETQPSDIEDLATTPAIDLFVQRARAVRPDFALTEGNMRDVVEICRRLDGLPLAIELAANRIRVLSPAALAGMLSERLRLLTDGPADSPKRQRTLRAAIAWSHDLLSDEQRAVFRRLAVFSGGCTLEAVTSVIANGDPFTAIEGLEALIDRGLVFRAEHGEEELRFGMLETIREYGRECLTRSGEAETIYLAHATYLIEFAEQAGPMLQGPDPGAWLDRLEREQDNFRTALAWSIGDGDGSGDAAIALKLAAVLWPFWHMRGRLQEGHGWLERAIARGDRVDPATRAAAFLTLANIANNLEDHDHATALYQESLRLNDMRGNSHGTSAALVGLGMVATSEGAYDRAEDWLRRAVDAHRSTGSAAGMLPAVYAYGRLGIAKGDYDEAERRFTEARLLCDSRNIGFLTYLSLEMAQLERYRGNLTTATTLTNGCLERFRQIGERRAEAACLAELGHLALHIGELHQAGEQLRAAAALHLELRDEFGVVRCLEGLAMLVSLLDHARSAALLAGAADAWRSTTKTVRILAEQESWDRLMATLRGTLDDDALKAASTAGRALGLDQAVISAGASGQR